MKQFLIAVSVLLLTLVSCKHKKKPVDEEDKGPFIPVVSFLKSQLAHIDTSLYSIQKIIIRDSLHSDTSWIKRDEVRGLAKDFLDIPDISEEKYSKRYTQKKLYDEGLNRAIFSYVPVNPDAEDVQLEEVLVSPNSTGDKVTSIIINRVTINKDSSIERRMLWQPDQSFQVTTITQKAGLPEVIYTIKVIWE